MATQSGEAWAVAFAVRHRQLAKAAKVLARKVGVVIVEWGLGCGVFLMRGGHVTLKGHAQTIREVGHSARFPVPGLEVQGRAHNDLGRTGKRNGGGDIKARAGSGGARQILQVAIGVEGAKGVQLGVVNVVAA